MIRQRVKEAYSKAAEQPSSDLPFPVGRWFAESLGYPADLPSTAIDAFTGVAAVSVFAEIPENATVLDLGCGAGLDSCLAARQARFVVGMDFSLPMLQRAALSGPRNAAFVQGDGERLPLRDASIDIAMVNGIFSLNSARSQIFSELARVVKPGGTVWAAELVRSAGSTAPPPNDANWFA